MAQPATREEFKKHCLRRLGHPVVRVDVTDEQVEDRVDEALNKFLRQHYDGSERVYLAHQVTTQEASEKKLTLDDTVLGVVDVFPLGFTNGASTSGFFNFAAFQVMLSDLIGANGNASGGLSSYVQLRMSISEIEQVLVGKFPFRYNEKTDELFLDVAAEKLYAGMYVLIEAHRVNDPEDYPDVWSDLWLQRYAAALIKKQWGTNLSKFSGQQLPGGITVNGVRIAAEADSELQQLEDDLTRTWSPIVWDMVG